MIKVKDKAALAAMGWGIDPNNPGQAIPLDQICRNGKSLEGLSQEALLALANSTYKSLLQSELSLARLYWEWGNILLELRKQHKGGWIKFVKANSWAQRKVDKALRIRRENPTPNILDDKTVEDALHYATEEGPSGSCNQTYILDDGRVVYYGSYKCCRYFWDGTTIEFGVSLDWEECADWPALEPPTEAQVETAFAKWKETPDEEQEQEQEQEQDDPEPDVDDQHEPETEPDVDDRHEPETEPDEDQDGDEGEPEPEAPVVNKRWQVTIIIDAPTQAEARAIAEYWSDNSPVTSVVEYVRDNWQREGF